MIHYEPKDLTVPEVHRLLLGGVGPRPIALVSTVSKEGIPNLTPFSFFNAFGSNPPVIAFSPSRRGKDAGLKDTYNNIVQTKECVVHSVTYPMVEQVNLASTEYPPGVNEFIKSGLTPIDSDLVKPKRVKESPFHMECKVREIFNIGEGGSSANIIICEVLKFHVAEDIFKNGIIHPDLIDLVGRMSGSFYTRARGSSIFQAERPQKLSIGYDMLPEYVKNSHIYSANNLGKFGKIEAIPTDKEVEQFICEIKDDQEKDFEPSEEAFFRYLNQNEYKKMLKAALLQTGSPKLKKLLELTAKCALEQNDLLFAWKTAVYAGHFI
ncbi:MAG TPA: flavin reductase family protein [Ignavibacteriaceae bacterium]|nr:flavin reductase family protein [Ignavibacteriaceae bacterium]